MTHEMVALLAGILLGGISFAPFWYSIGRDAGRSSVWEEVLSDPHEREE